MRSTRILTAILALGLAALPAAAQTPEAACAADSLYLISPDLVHLDLQEDGRLGMVVSWPNLDLNEATCFSLKNTDGLGFAPVVSGGFGDRVDRILGFSSADSGSIGGGAATPLSVSWRSVGATTYGNLAGIINLANNGGILRWDESAGAWVQLNGGLPMTWRQTNVVALAEGGDGVMYAGFTSGQSVDIDPKGIFRHDGTAWTRVGADVITNTQRVTGIAVDPGNSDRVAVGTALGGLFVSGDRGQTFANWTANLDPAYTQPASYQVTALAWSGGRLFVAVANLGVFVSTDAGASFSRVPLWVPDNLDKLPENRIPILPLVNAFTFDPAAPQPDPRLALLPWGVRIDRRGHDLGRQVRRLHRADGRRRRVVQDGPVGGHRSRQPAGAGDGRFAERPATARPTTA